MCGIAGIFSFQGQPVKMGWIEKLTESLAHRGQDGAKNLYISVGSGSSSYTGVALGHRRLAIIDLSESSIQPMRSLKTGNVLVYNGELYNYLELKKELQSLGHHFRTKSDSEVILAAYDAWGGGCVERFNGMFAFSIWDEFRQCFFCARDPIGIKPFYYILNTSEFTFSSESQALAKLYNPGLNPEAVNCYFLMMYVPRELSIHNKVRKLLPGHAIFVYRDGTSEVFEYWKLPAQESKSISFIAAAKEMESILDASVKRQLQSDVPIGLMLSGGFDSGMILASASKTGIPLHTYSIGYEQVDQDSDLMIADEMARRYKTKHHERILKHNEIMPILNRAISCISEPVFDSTLVPSFCLSDMAKDSGVKVLLSGAGGDEIFAGYSRYVSSSKMRKLLYYLPDFLRQEIIAGLFSSSLLGARLRHRSLDMMIYTGGSVALASSLLKSKKSFLNYLEYLACSVFPSPCDDKSSLYQHMHHDLRVYLPDLLLMILDQLTMAHTIEGRVPLLDLELILAAYRLPASYHANPHSKKTRLLMRQMSQGRISAATFSARKQGFSGPVELWVNSNKAQFREAIMSLRSNSIVGDIPIEKFWKSGVNEPSRGWAMQIFSLYCFSIWMDSHGF